MRINNTKIFSKDELFYCYSPNLYVYFNEHDIDPIKRCYDKKARKYFTIFVKDKRVEKCLVEWGKMKDRGECYLE